VTPTPPRITRLPSGLRIATDFTESVRSVSVGFFVKVGSRHEQDEQSGLSHFLEHLLFKGTDRFSSSEIDEIFDAMGAEVNAGTSRETTSLYGRFLDQHLERAFDVMGDMVLRPSYPDIDSERQVVLEEIAMYEDEPSDKVHDVLAAAMYADHPLGRPIIGRAEVIAGVSVPSIAAYHDAAYVPANVVVAAAGNVEHEHIVELAERAFGDSNGPPDPSLGYEPAPAGNGAAALRFHVKPTEQYHLCLGGPGLARADERRFALRVLDTAFGGSSSSRLFQEVREKRGLAYSVFSYSSQFLDAGQVAVYVGTRPDRVEEAVDVLGNELRRLRDEPVSGEELERAKENVKGRTVLSMESTLARMNRLGGAVLADTPVLTLDEVLARIDAVSAEDVEALADELWAPEALSAAGVGAAEEPFRAALDRVHPALAA
jgi:predicted Zn-dependent peptidase